MSGRPVNACPACGFAPKPQTPPTPAYTRAQRQIEARSRVCEQVGRGEPFLGIQILQALTENA